MVGPVPSTIGTIIGSVAFRDHRVAIGWSTGGVEVYDLETGARAAAFDTHGNTIFGVGFSADGTRLAVGGLFAQLRSVDGSPSIGRLLPAATPQTTVFSPDGQLLLQTDRSTARVLDASTATMRVGPFPLPFDGIFNFTPESKHVALPSGPTTVSLVDVQTGLPEGAPFSDPSLGAVIAVTFSGDGRRVAVGGLNRLSVFDVATRSLLMQTGDLAPPSAIRFPASYGHLDPTGQRVYVTQGGLGEVRVYDVDAATVVGEVTFPFLQGSFLSADGSLLVLGSGNQGSIGIFNAHTLEFIRTAKPHNSTLISAVFDPRAKRVATLSGDGTSKLVDVATGAVFDPGFPGAGQGRVRFSPDGSQLVVAAAAGGALIWDVEPDAWRRRACELVGRNLTTDEWTRYLPNGGDRRPTCPQWPLSDRGSTAEELERAENVTRG